MAEMSQVTLYDIPSKSPPKPWSLNPWKTRLLLNYKGIDYKTEWIEYPDLVPVFKSYGLPPNDPDSPGYFTDYSSPAIRYEDGSYGMDSWKIVQETEKRYPTPSMHLDEPVVIQVRDSISSLMLSLAAFVLPNVPKILNPVSAEYFERTRKEMLGTPLSQFAEEKATEQAWAGAKQLIEDIAELLKQNEGPFFLGKTVSYADFIFVTFLKMYDLLNKEAFERILAFDPALGAVYAASKEWFEKDD